MRTKNAFRQYAHGIQGLVLIVLMIFVALSQPSGAQAQTYTFHPPTIAVSKPVDFKDGSFEDMAPRMTASHIILDTYGTVNMPSTFPISEYWSTFPVSIAGNNHGITAMNDYRCWLLEISSNPGTYGLSSAADGSNFAELNAYAAGRLYQNVATVPGSRIYWQFAHAGRTGVSPSTPDVMKFSLKPAGSVWVAPTAGQIQKQATATSTAWTTYGGAYVVPAGQTNTQFGFEAVSSSNGRSDFGNMLDDIKFQTGASLVTEKSIENSSGQRIDGGYGEFGDTVTISLKIANWGETDADPCVLTDILWDGLQFVPGSGTVTGDSGIVGTVSSSGSVVTARIGVGATSTTGGTIKGSQSMGTSDTSGKGQTAVVTYQATITGAPKSAVNDQASVSYNDKGYESYNPVGGLTSYSTVDYGIADANYLGVAGHGTYTMNMLNPDGSTRVTYDHTDLGNEETYVNHFTVTNREVDGNVWYDSNENGVIDPGEMPISTTVKMQKLVSGIWTDATDWSGMALTATTDAAGSYEFNGILSGQYRVLAQIADGDDRVVKFKNSTPPTEVVTTTGTQGSYDNDADATTITDSGATWAVVQTLDKTSDASTPVAETYYTHHVDFGFVPSPTITKGCEIIGTGNTDQGSAESPVDVLYGDVIKYTLTVTNNSDSNISENMITVTDELPDGLTYVSSTVTPTTVDGQNVEWSDVPSIPSKTSYVITVTARVTEPGKDIFNTAHILEPDSTDTPSNTTYHTSKGLTLTIAKMVKGNLADPQKEFGFDISLGDSQPDLLSGLGTTGSQYTYRDELAGVDLPGGGTAAFGDTASSVSLKHGQSVTFHDLPMGIKYLLNETSNSGYVWAVSITNETSNAGAANTGAYSDLTQTTEGFLNSNDAEVDYANTKAGVPPTDVILEFWPYLLVLLLAVGIGTGLIIRRVQVKRHRGRHARRPIGGIEDKK